MQSRIKEHLTPQKQTTDKVHEQYIKGGRGCKSCNFPFLAPDKETGDLTCQNCYAIAGFKWCSGDEELFVGETLIAVKQDDVNDYREIGNVSEVYPNEVASRMVYLRMPNSPSGNFGVYPYNPTLINLN